MTLRVLSLAFAVALPALAEPTFNKDVLPILQKRCQECHRPGEAAPMPFLNFEQVRPWAKAIRSAVIARKMPPWGADPAHGEFSNDRRLSKAEIDTITQWVDGGTPVGNPKDAPAPLEFTEGWNIGKPDLVIEIPTAYHIPANGSIPYQYILVPTGFTEDKWVERVEIRPENRAVTHHVIASAANPDSRVVKTRKPGEYFAIPPAPLFVEGKPDPDMFSFSMDSESLEIYLPGTQAPQLKPGQARLIRAGASLFFQLHYTPTGKPETDRTRVGFIFAKHPPKEHVEMVTVQNFAFSIPANEPNHRIQARAIVNQDMTVVSLAPHMHLRGKSFDYKVTYPNGESETLLFVPHWDFNWQLTYNLKIPKLLPKGTLVVCTGYYDNSANNPFNPDPNSRVDYGEQTWQEMLGGIMDVSIDPKLNAPILFVPAT